MIDSAINLVADVDGSNIRIGPSCSNGNVSHIETFECAQFSSLANIF